MIKSTCTALTALLLATLALPALAAESAAAPDWIERSRQLATQLGGELKGELGKAIETSGPVAAIGVCSTRAPEIAARLSRESGAQVGRTALRVRNPANAPDDLQRALLEQFAGEMASGRFQPLLEAAFEIRRGQQVERRYIRAYPADQATGFEQGQLRGAFTVTWPAAAPSPGH